MLKKVFELLGGKKTQNQHITIMVVDDNEMDLCLVVSTLERAGYSVVSARDGGQALEIIRKQLPDVALLDCEMPVMGGVELCRQMKADPSLSHIPVLFFTGNDTPRNIIDCFEMEAQNFLKKPLIAKILLEQIKMMVVQKSGDELLSADG